MIDETLVQRLAFVKYLYELAVTQSKQPEPLSSASVLTFHDSIEMFLLLSSEHLNIGSNKPNFMDYWDLLNQKLTTELTQKESMRRLNKARVALKHHGTMPSRLDIEAIRASATNFFNENCLTVFGFEFKNISMISLVDCSEARVILEEATDLIQNNQFTKALVQIAVAFHILIDDYESKQMDSFGRSPFFFGRSLNFESSFFMGIREDRKLADFVDKVRESIMSMQSAIKIVSLGLDYRKYVKFRLLTPVVQKTIGGRYVSDINPNQEYTQEHSEFCLKYVIESALRLQDFDFEEL